jgi:hypothetical protein
MAALSLLVPGNETRSQLAKYHHSTHFDDHPCYELPKKSLPLNTGLLHEICPL